MTDRYADDIKRIVGIDPDKSTLLPKSDKSSIPGKRGIGYVDQVSGGARGYSGTSGTTQLPSDFGIGDQKDLANTAGEKASNPNNIQNGITRSTDRVVNVEDIIDGVDEASKMNTPQITQSGTDYLNNSIMNGINAEDCDTGKDLNIRLRNGWVPPTGWTDADTPPDVTNWTTGKYHMISAGSAETGISLPAGYGSTVTFLANDYIEVLDGYVTDRAPWELVSVVATGGGAHKITYKDKNSITVYWSSSEEDCTADPPPSYSANCPIVAPKERYWPDDDTVSFKFEDGKFKTSGFDNDVPAKWVNDTSKLDFCFGTGRTGSIETMRNGGYAIYETSGGSPAGLIRVYDSAGQLVAAGDNTTEWLDAYRP